MPPEAANAGAQAGHYLGIPVLHVEAGLRSHDRKMPEETNRLLVSALADVHCCATRMNAEHLLGAGVSPKAVHITGNPVVEAVRTLLPDAATRTDLLASRGVERPFVLSTIHRPENTDDIGRLRTVLEELDGLDRRVVLPLHPRTAVAIDRARLVPGPNLQLLPPVDYGAFLTLTAEADIVVSDSGGIQEAVTVLGRPLVVVRTSTERPESVEVGFSRLCAPGDIDATMREMEGPEVAERIARSPSPYGDGRASERIAALALRACRHRLAGGHTAANRVPGRRPRGTCEPRTHR